jgi:hypothetical protein
MAKQMFTRILATFIKRSLTMKTHNMILPQEAIMGSIEETRFPQKPVSCRGREEESHMHSL